MIKNIIIGILAITTIGLVLYIDNIKNQQKQIVEQAIQSTSDSLLVACENRIDEILGQF